MPQPSTRQHMIRDARFSDDELYRYWLIREWDHTLPKLAWCGLNPSIASHLIDDQTIRREIDFSAMWGYGGLIKVNLFGLVSTNPAELVRFRDPIGSENDDYLWALTDGTDVIACWGGGVIAHRLRRDRTTWHLGLTKTGQPRHPSRLARSTERTRWLTRDAA